MTLDEWASSAWNLLGIRPLSLQNYQWKYKKHISPVFGKVLLQDITRKDVQLWVLQLSPSVGRAVLPVLSSLLREAVNYELIDSNVCMGIKKKPHTAPRRDFPLMEQLPEITPERYLPAILFVAKHGLRASEAYGLTARDIADAEATGVLTVNKTSYGQATKSGKTRSVPYVQEYVRIPKSRQFRECIQPYVFHSLRKTYAYWLKSNGVHITTIQKLLGHSNIQTTMIYLDSREEEVLQVAELLRSA